MQKNIPTTLGLIIILIFAATAFFLVYQADSIMAASGMSIL